MRTGTALKRIEDEDGERHERVDVWHVETSQDIETLRADESFHDGRMAIMKYATAPTQGILRNTPPLRSIRFMPGAYLTKSAAGVFGILHLEEQKGFVEA
jgi:hypothetical protein